jgi:polar amino acid transport system permease protein
MSLESLTPLAHGALVTIEVTVAAAVLAVIVAVVAGLGRSSRVWVVRAVAGLFVEVFRGTSAVVQLYVAFFVLPFAGLALSPFSAGVLACGLNAGSYGAEIVRAGLASVPEGQREAAIALDMPAWQTFRRVVWPNAMILILRPAGNQLIDLLKLTSIVSLVTLHELTYEGQILRNETGETVQIFLALLVVYFAFASGLAALVNVLERHVRRGIDGTAKAKRPASSAQTQGDSA